ncbi:MAG: hypothetical protein FWE09_02305 [Treponema sp.]|nr:hypothetical protein [Treponema sp.]
MLISKSAAIAKGRMFSHHFRTSVDRYAYKKRRGREPSFWESLRAELYRVKCEGYVHVDSPEARLDDLLVEVRSRACFWTILISYALSTAIAALLGGLSDGLGGALAGAFAGVLIFGALASFFALAIFPEIVCSIVEARIKSKERGERRRSAPRAERREEAFRYQRVTMMHQGGIAPQRPAAAAAR